MTTQLCDIFHLEARSAFHFGIRGVGLEETTDYMPSDTLFSALCHALLAVEGNTKLEEMLSAFAGDDVSPPEPPFLITGGFPYTLLDGAPLRFYPAPLALKGENFGKSELSDIRWVSEAVFDLYCRHKVRDETFGKQVCIVGPQHPDVAVTTSEITSLRKTHGPSPQLWSITEAPRVTVDRITSASAVYHAGRLVYANGGGLWFAIAYLTNDWNQSRVSGLLQELKYSGIGGERSAGHGQFELGHIQALSLPIPSAKDNFVALAHIHPRKDEMEMFSDKSAYTLTIRRGWVSSPQLSNRRRKSVRMVRSGSVLTALGDHRYYGSLVRVTPDNDLQTDFRVPHPVYRYGLSLPFKIS